MEYSKIERMAQMISGLVAEEKIPGAVLLVGNGGNTDFCEAWGWAQLTPERLPMTKDTLFDIASLSKLVGTWPGIMLLLQEGKISLDSKLQELLHHQKMHPGLENLTVWHLLTHTGGLIPGRHPAEFGETREERIDGLMAIAPEFEPNTKVQYSDLSFIFLGEILAEKMGEKQNFVADEIFNALGMHSTRYCPPEDAYCAATEVKNGVTIRGRVHDTTAYELGGVAGHAGVFSTAEDLGRFCAAILPPSPHPVFDTEWLKKAYTNQTAHLGEDRALGWIAYRERPEGNVVGHTGFTGTSMWLDTVSGDYVILLTNRVHPTRANDHLWPVRREMLEVAFGK